MRDVPLLVIFPMLMAYAAASDLFTMTIPNKLSLALVAGFAALALLGGLAPVDVAMHVAAGGLVLLATFTMFALGWIGGGDAKLAAATALWLGFDQLLDYLFLSALGGGILSVSILALRHTPLPPLFDRWPWFARLRQDGGGVPYGIALAVAALIVYPHSQIFSSTLGL